MPVLVISFALTSMIWLTQSLKFIDLIVNRGLNIGSFLYLSSLLIPSLLFLILPLALLASVLMVYNRFISDSELIVLKSAGISRLQLAYPALLVGLLVTAVTYSISFYFLPASYKELKNTQAYIKNNYASVLLQEGVFSTPVNGLTVYIETRGKNGVFEGIMVDDSRDPEEAVTLIAEKGFITTTKNGPRLELQNGHGQSIDKKSGNLYVVDFKSDQHDINLYSKPSNRKSKKPEEKYIHELLNPDIENEKLYTKFIAEGHYRLIWPLFNFVFVLISLAFLFSGQFSRRGQWKRLLSILITTTFIVVINLALKSAATKNLYLVPLMYIYVFSILSISMAIISRSKRLDISNIFVSSNK